MNRVVKIILAIAIVILVPKLIQRVAFGSPTDKAMAALRQTVQEVVPTLPKKLDAVTTITNVEVSGHTYKIYYTMDPSVRYDASRKDSAEQTAKHQICDGSNRVLSDAGITVEYLYTFPTPSGTEKMSVVVPSGSCG